MATLVEAWAADPPAAPGNLLIIGGDLEHPSDDEREQLDRIASGRAAHGGAGRRVCCSRDTAPTTWWPAGSPPPGSACPDWPHLGGVYVCASVKEEFGIALLEAMATGLIVVAPDGGGPATYVEDGVTGFLVDTGDRVALAQGIRRALDFAAGPTGRAGAERARAMVAQTFTIEAMATALDRRLPRARRTRAVAGPRGECLVTLLVISPDYASHLLPLATLATAWRGRGRAGGRRHRARHGRHRRGRSGSSASTCRLGRGSNPGVIRADQQPAGEDDSLRGFFDATRRGMRANPAVPGPGPRATTCCGTRWRSPTEVQQIVERLRPDAMIVDHLAFSARLGLISGGIRHADVVLGHPTALPVGHEVYGYPPRWPPAFTPEPADLAALRQLCEEVRDDFTAAMERRARTSSTRTAAPSADAFAEHGDVLLLNYPAALHDETRTRTAPPARLPGFRRPRGTGRRRGRRPGSGGHAGQFVYVSFGSFLSVRGDVLARVAAALRGLDVRAAIATGSTRSTELGELPLGWLVRDYLPQVRPAPPRRARRHPRRQQHRDRGDDRGRSAPRAALLDRPVRGRGGRRAAGFGAALDPNAASVEKLRTAASGFLTLSGEARGRLEQLSASLTDCPGPRRAYEALHRLPV